MENPEELQLLSDLGISPVVLKSYQILCLPENIGNRGEHSELVDAEECVTLSKLLKQQGVKCANSYDLGLSTRIAERRGLDLWLGSIWVLENAALPLVINIIGRLVGERIIQRKLRADKQLKDAEAVDKAVVHANLKIIDQKTPAEIMFHGDVDTFLKLFKGLHDEQSDFKK